MWPTNSTEMPMQLSTVTMGRALNLSPANPMKPRSSSIMVATTNIMTVPQ
jgi:hypothetical protein